MSIASLTPILNVSDVPASFAWFTALGFTRGFAWNDGGMIPGGADSNAHGPAHFGSVCTPTVQIFLCNGAQGSRGTIEPRFPGDDATDGVWMSWWVDSLAALAALHARAVAAGHRITKPPTDEPWGVREFHLRHPDGHTFRVSAALGKAHG